MPFIPQMTKLQMDAPRHAIKVPPGSKAIAVRGVSIPNALTNSRGNPLPPKVEVYLILHIPVRPMDTDVDKIPFETIFVQGCVVGQDIVPNNGEYIGTVSYEGVFINFYVEEGAIDA